MAAKSPRRSRVGRPGAGGRLPRSSPFTGTSATADLIAELGQPQLEVHGSTQLLLWPVHADGDGIILGRLSGREVEGGETAMGQIHPLRALAGRLELRPRLIVMSIQNSGMRPYADRPDFALIEEAIGHGWCKWVAWRGPDRIAREVLPAETFYDLLRCNRVGLYLNGLGREVDWQRDRIYLRALGLVSAEEASSIKERTHTAIRSRYIAEGRGWPSSKRFGFRRNWATKYLEPDPDQWEFVKRIHLGYADAATDHRGGLRTVRDELMGMGCELSHQRLVTILRDRIYVDGSFAVMVDGEVVPQRRIVLTDPIPEAVFQRNQELLDLRKGRERTARIGDFCLNGIPIVHEPCVEIRDGRGLRAFLKGRVNRRVRAYRHSPWVPHGCRGFVIDQDALERPVLDALRTFADSPELVAAWAEHTRSERRGLDSDVVSPRQRRQLARKIREKELQKAQLVRSFTERLSDGDEVNELAYWELVGALTTEIDQLRSRHARSSLTPTVSTEQAHADLRSAFDAILTPDVPDDDALRVQRAALVQALVREVRVSDRDGAIAVEVETTLPVRASEHH